MIQKEYEINNELSENLTISASSENIPIKAFIDKMIEYQTKVNHHEKFSEKISNLVIFSLSLTLQNLLLSPLYHSLLNMDDRSGGHALAMMLFLITLFITILIPLTTEYKFKWVKKLMMKRKKCREDNNVLTMRKNHLKNMCLDENFQHIYLARIEIKLNHYEDIIKNLNKIEGMNQQIEFITKHLKNIKDSKNEIINAFIQKKSEYAIILMRTIENSLFELNNHTYNTQNNEEFINRYQAFLEKSDLKSLMKKIESSESNIVKPDFTKII